MPRYMIFEKDKNFKYKFKGFSTAPNRNKALQQRQGKGAGLFVKSTGIYIVIPDRQFMNNQVNPTTKVVKSKKLKGFKFKETNWKRPR